MKLREEFGLPTPGRGGRPRGGNGEMASAVRPCPVEGSATSASGQNRRGGAGRGFVTFGADTLPAERHEEFNKRLAAIDAKYPAAPRASVKDFVNHIDYAVKMVGIDHVGISSDFDGGGGIDGWDSAAEAFNVTLELVRRGYTEKEIGKLWSGNLLRVWGEVEAVAKKLQKG